MDLTMSKMENKLLAWESYWKWIFDMECFSMKPQKQLNRMLWVTPIFCWGWITHNRWRELGAQLQQANEKEGIWKETADFTDPCLQGLAPRLQKSALSARAPSTTSTYHRAFKRWKDFAVSNVKGNYLPANPIHVAVYLQHVLESTKSCSSVDSAFYAIKWVHEIAGMASPTDNQVVSWSRHENFRRWETQ